MFFSIQKRFSFAKELGMMSSKIGSVRVSIKGDGVNYFHNATVTIDGNVVRVDGDVSRYIEDVISTPPMERVVVFFDLRSAVIEVVEGLRTPV